MKTMTFEQAETILNNSKLMKKELTYERSGYPKFGGENRFAFYGFNTYEDALSMANKVGGTVEQIYWKDGQSLGYSLGLAYNALSISSEDYGDDYNVFDNPTEEFETLKEKIEYVSDIEGIYKLLSEYESLLEEFEDKENDEWIVTYNNRYFETLKNEPMEWSHDTKNYVIAVVINDKNY